MIGFLAVLYEFCYLHTTVEWYNGSTIERHMYLLCLLISPPGPAPKRWPIFVLPWMTVCAWLGIGYNGDQRARPAANDRTDSAPGLDP